MYRSGNDRLQGGSYMGKTSCSMTGIQHAIYVRSRYGVEGYKSEASGKISHLRFNLSRRKRAKPPRKISYF